MTGSERSDAISKVLSSNDTGDTGGHQAGMLIPKDPAILSFFPSLDRKLKNPRHHLVFHDDAGTRWEFAFIYYNNKFFGGTRNEYRLTRLTNFVRLTGLQPGDVIILRRENGGERRVSYRRAKNRALAEKHVLKLGSTWKVIDF